jgi:serine/threonine-protein kinase
MEDPPALESVSRGVPSAFAAVVRKLMNKKPDERYQDCAELRADLTRWTDPRRVHAILGAEAEAARSFRPPPPELDEDDLRLFDGDDPSIRDAATLRLLGDPEPSVAPRHQHPLPPATAVVRPAPSREARSARPSLARASGDDSTWLFQFAMIAIAVGLVAVILIAIFFRT